MEVINCHIPTTFRAALSQNTCDIRIPYQFYSRWKGLIEIGECKIMDVTGNTFSIQLKNLCRTVVKFTKWVTTMIFFYGFKTKHEAEFRYRGSNKFTLRIYAIDGQEIMYPMVSGRQPESRLPQTSPPTERRHQITVMNWLYTVTNVVSTGRQPLYFLVAYVKDWQLHCYNKVVLINVE
ncbi:hypothetical protein Fmac_026273 [Flemingia macrophylla]|uniref:Uncharacterized protein n=1 Tax=Flemingia macrophylla TaxID=520843 RepID=A0ABD1LEE7_9FABA